MILSIIIGLVIWLALPLFLTGLVKKKNDKRGFERLCMIVGLAIIVIAVIKYIIGLF